MEIFNIYYFEHIASAMVNMLSPSAVDRRSPVGLNQRL